MNYLCPQICIVCKNSTYKMHAGRRIHTHTHAHTHARTHVAAYLRLRSTFVYGMTSLLFDKTSLLSETLFPAFHRVRTSTLGRFT